jgi:hypothetical protein
VRSEGDGKDTARDPQIRRKEPMKTHRLSIASRREFLKILAAGAIGAAREPPRRIVHPALSL